MSHISGYDINFLEINQIKLSAIPKLKLANTRISAWNLKKKPDADILGSIIIDVFYHKHPFFLIHDCSIFLINYPVPSFSFRLEDRIAIRLSLKIC